MADREGVKIFQADIIYHLFDRRVFVVLWCNLKLYVTSSCNIIQSLCPKKMYVEHHHQVHWIPSGHREEEERAVREDRGVPLQTQDAARSHLHSQRSHCCWSQGWGEWLSDCNQRPVCWKSRRIMESQESIFIFECPGWYYQVWHPALCPEQGVHLLGNLHITSGKKYAHHSR